MGSMGFQGDVLVYVSVCCILVILCLNMEEEYCSIL